MNKMFLATKLILIASLSQFFVSCTKKVDQNEKVLNIAVSSEVKGMDPIYSNDLYSSNEVGRVYEGLLEYHYLKRPYTLQPNLAESMPEVSEDGLTYTFKIKKGIKFQDNKCFPNGKGRELVASDFVYSIKRLSDPKLQGLGWWVIDGKIKGLNEWRDKNAEKDKTDYSEKIEGLLALDDHTLQFKLTKPFPQFLYSLAMTFTFAVPREAVEFYGKEFVNHPVGTGPYMLPEYKQTSKIVYTKNPTFRKKLFPSEGASEEFQSVAKENKGRTLPLVDKLVVNIMKESQPRWLNFQKGRVDFIAIPKDNFDTAVTPGKGLSDDLKKKGISLLISPQLDVTYSAFNHDMELFQNKKLRRAMSLAYDIKASNKLFYNDTGLPAQSIVPPGIAGNMRNYVSPYRNKNLEEAKKLLAEAGFPEGKGLQEITYDCPSSTVARQQAEFFKKQMAEIGINIKVVLNTWPELQKKIQKRQVQMWGIAWGADYPDAENFLQLLYGPNKSPGANGSGYDNPEFNELFKKAAIMQDTPERTALYEKLTRMAAEEVPIIYGLHRQAYQMTQGWLKNYVYTDFTAGREQYLDVDTKSKVEMIKKL